MNRSQANAVHHDDHILLAIREGQALVAQNDILGAERMFLDALDQLVLAYQQRVVGFCVDMLSLAWKHQAEDVAQDAFLAAHRHMPRFRGEASISTWLFAIVRKRCWSAIRTFKREDQRRTHSETIMPQLVDEQPLPGQHYERREAQALLQRGLEQLPHLDRVLLHMYSDEDVSTREIAAMLDINEAAVRQRVRRALQRLRRIMQTF
ncbi:hypothetical protein C2W62_08490 [Candidatus Entotheonella serta]|nr:hypothetical protein C2W62_08490 [Candidatus Entotheonella serta]